MCYDFGLRPMDVCRVFLNVMTRAITTRAALVVAVVTIVAVFAGVAPTHVAPKDDPVTTEMIVITRRNFFIRAIRQESGDACKTISVFRPRILIKRVE